MIVWINRGNKFIEVVKRVYIENVYFHNIGTREKT